MTPIQIKLIAAGILLVLAFGTGWKIRGWEADSDIAAKDAELAKLQSDAKDARAAFQEQATTLERAQADLTTANAFLITLKQQKQEVVTRTITKEVIRYAQNPDRPVVLLPAAWVSIHNAAAIGATVLPDTASTAAELHDSTGPATDADALGTVTSNYALYHDTALNLEGMQAYGRQIEEFRKQVIELNHDR